MYREMDKCKFCNKETQGEILIYGEGTIPICADSECRDKAGKKDFEARRNADVSTV